MKKPRVCVIFGGKSQEYFVSLRSAYTVLNNIDKEKYIVSMIGITKEGKWYLYGGDIHKLLDDSWTQAREELLPVTIDIFNEGVSVFHGITTFFKPDLVIPMVHGEFCEDGRLQSVFESAGISYLGCDSYTSFLCYNKLFTKHIASSLGIKVAEHILVSQADLGSFYRIIADASTIEPPFFVKPVYGGSSIGASRVNSINELFPACLDALRYSDFALVERFIEGTECEVAILYSKGELIISDVGSIEYQGKFYDYKTKYSDSTVKYNIPAKISKSAREEIKASAHLLTSALKLKAPCRLDFFVCKNGDVYLNEINTLPGFTNDSMYPMLFNAMGYSISSIIDSLIEGAEC